MAKSKKPSKVKVKREEKRPDSTELEDNQLDQASGGLNFTSNLWPGTTNPDSSLLQPIDESQFWIYKG